MSNKPTIDTRTVRVSDHFLLSDFMGCHSVYVKGFANVFTDPDGSKLEEIKCLATNVLEPLVGMSPLSITYGYISLDLARKIVTYQSPEKPSYHQWNDGAACDVVIHALDAQNIAPALLANWIDTSFPMSRTISYSESSGLCLATKVSEVSAGKPRKALYENRYEGVPKAKPAYVNYSNNPKTRQEQKAACKESYYSNPSDYWRGAGYPTYHGGGVRQLHHVRTGYASLYSDFMFSEFAVQRGHKNALVPTDRWMMYMSHIGAVYDALLERLGVNRCSIVRAYESVLWSKDPLFTWVNGFCFEIVPPAGYAIEAGEIAQQALHVEGVHSAGSGSVPGSVRIAGDWPK